MITDAEVEREHREWERREREREGEERDDDDGAGSRRHSVTSIATPTIHATPFAGVSVPAT